MKKAISRRLFINQTAKTTAVLTSGALIGGSFLSACSSSKKTISTVLPTTGLDQTPLPYSYSSLEPFIDAQTMELHYSKHAAAYSKNTKEAAAAENVKPGTSVETLLASISIYSTKLRNNAGGHYNHELFWKSMKPGAVGNPPEKLSNALIKSFGSFETFKNQFTEAGKNRFGSGWAWLYMDRDHQLRIGSTPNQDNPLMDVSDIKGFPLLGLDVWEHAYYLKYQNKRADYIQAWWNLVNWDYVLQRYESV